VHQSTVAIEYAREVENLQEAMNTRKTIGQAIGIVMERYGLTEDRAFAFLTRLSQQRNVKLRLVAAELVSATEEERSRER
jgi:AmiR/NasT family two-component response regulator